MEGVDLFSCDAKFGVLGIFHTSELAERVGEAWADLQFKSRVYDYCETEEEEWEALEGLSKGKDKRVDGNWQYSSFSERCESLMLEVNEISVVTHVDGFEDEEDEEGINNILCSVRLLEESGCVNPDMQELVFKTSYLSIPCCRPFVA